MQIDLEALKPWLGRTETREDILTPGLIDRFRATFGAHLWAGAGDVPLGIHWCLTLDSAPGGSLSDDGHSPQGQVPAPCSVALADVGRERCHAYRAAHGRANGHAPFDHRGHNRQARAAAEPWSL